MCGTPGFSTCLHVDMCWCLGVVGASRVKDIVYHACKPNVSAALQHSWLQAQVSSYT